MRSEPAMCPSAVRAGSPHGFCVAHDALYAAMREFGHLRQSKSYEVAVAWAREHRYSATELGRLNERFDPNCVTYSRTA